MSNDNGICHGGHCVFLMHAPWIFVTKYRRGVFTKEIIDDLRPIFATGEQSQGNFQPAYQEEELPQDYGVALCGHPATLPEAVEAHRLRLFASTSSSSVRRVRVKGRGKDGFAVRAYIPALNDGVLRANPINTGARNTTLETGR